MGTHYKCLAEALLMSTHNICFHWEIRKVSAVFGWKKVPYLLLWPIVYNYYIIEGEKWLNSQYGTKVKINLPVTTKPHAHPHTKKKTHAKFYNNQGRTVRGVAFTRGTNCLYMKGEKSLRSICRKSDKNNLTIISKPLAYSHTTIGTKLL